VVSRFWVSLIHARCSQCSLCGPCIVVGEDAIPLQHQAKAAWIVVAVGCVGHLDIAPAVCIGHRSLSLIGRGTRRSALSRHVVLDRVLEVLQIDDQRMLKWEIRHTPDSTQREVAIDLNQARAARYVGTPIVDYSRRVSHRGRRTLCGNDIMRDEDW
jgi:hypothetical protein